MAKRQLAPPFLLKHPFRTDRVLAKAEFPVLLFHGLSDDVIPVSEARKLRDIAAENTRDVRYVEFPGDHNSFPPPELNDKFWRIKL